MHPPISNKFPAMNKDDGMKSSLLPTTTPGKWSIRLAAAAILLFTVFFIDVALGFRGGDHNGFKRLLPNHAGHTANAGRSVHFVGHGNRNNKHSEIKREAGSFFLATRMSAFILVFVLGKLLVPH